MDLQTLISIEKESYPFLVSPERLERSTVESHGKMRLGN